MTKKPIRVLGVAALCAWGLLVGPAPAASAAPCPDVELVFARGTFEAPGVGGIGQGFVDAVRSKLGAQSLNVYAVQYPASTDFPTAAEGIDDAATHIEATAANCPDTRVVLGGFSQGAAVAGFVTANEVPDGAPSGFDTEPMSPDIADHVAAVALFGKPSSRFLNAINVPDIAIGPLYAPKLIELCATGDPICSDGEDRSAHASYVANGMTDRAATFVVGRL